MIHYLIRRVLVGAVTLLLITFVIYGLIRAMPGSPLTIDLAEVDPSRRISEDDYQRLAKTYGLDKHWVPAYFTWLGHAVQLDFDRSFKEKKPVGQVIGARIGPTLQLEMISLLFSYFLAVPLGLFATVRSGRADERLISLGLYMLYSLPSFVAALWLLMIFYVRLEGTALQLPLAGMVSENYEQLSFGGKALDRLRHLILPVTCLSYGSLAYFSRFVKANMQEAIRQDYIRTAVAKGAGPFRVVVVHAFRNTLIPFVTLVGLTLPVLVSGSVILEYVFTWPGMGQLFFDSIHNRDYPVIMALTLIFALMTLAGQLLADILYAIVDPRVTYS
ncbi:MAG: ABC transporter permease [Pirellulaceae bacterium]